MLDELEAEDDFVYGVPCAGVWPDCHRIYPGTGEKVVQEVLQGGREYFSDNVELDGKAYYGYYIPVEHRGEIIGMVLSLRGESEGA